MRLTQNIYLVGSGRLGFGLSHESDCHVYLVDAGSELVLIDAGVGLDWDRIVANIRAEGLDPTRLTNVLLTHAHADHAGGSKQWKQEFGVRVLASPEAAQFVRSGDEAGISLSAAKAGGFYPLEYHFSACPVDRELREGDTVQVADFEFRVLETSGHCMGMVSFLLEIGGKTYLFCGDTIFHGGKILVTNVYDCDVQQYIKSLRKLAGLSVDALLPGHLGVTLNGGQAHIQTALDCLDRMVLPPNIL